MSYVKCKWEHECDDLPIWTYCELDERRYETRVVEVFKNGDIYFSSEHDCNGPTELGLCPFPVLEEVNESEELNAVEISKDEFEEMWQLALKYPRMD